MVDKSRFSRSLLDQFDTASPNGRLMASVSKSVLLIDYTDEEYDKEFFSVFNLIVDEEGEGVDPDELEKLYKNSFINAVTEFRRFFAI